MISYLSVHHTGPTASDPRASTAHHKSAVINAYHKQRWPDFPSRLNGSYGGYTLFINLDGTWDQFRFVGEELAANIGFNKTSIAVCLAGNFTNGSPDVPTYQQKKTLSDIGQACLKGKRTLEMMGIKCTPDVEVNITLDRIVSHRQLNPHTECYGSKLANDWARTVVMAGQQPDNLDQLRLSLMQEVVRLYLQVLDLLRKKHFAKQTLGSIGDRGCVGFIS